MERCGKYYRQAGPGANCVCYPVDEIVGVVNMRVQQLDVEIETKTLDNVFVMVVVSIQYSPIQERLWEAFYSLQDHKHQIRAYIEDVVRAVLPTQSLERLHEQRADQGRLVEGCGGFVADHAVLRHAECDRHAAGHADGVY